MQPLLITVTIPGHKPDQEPDNVPVGRELDALLIKHFLGKDVVVRCIGSRDHPDIGLDALANIILTTGTDKYDAGRTGIGYGEFSKKGIKVDFYGEDVVVSKNMSFMAQQIWEMHHSAIGDRGFGVHVDLVMVYDRSKLDMVMDLYDHHSTSDGFVFKDALHKKEALLGVIKVVG